MLKLARTIHFDGSDQNVISRPAESGEWAISGGFEFSNWTEADLIGKARQAFANGWLSLDRFGRATFVAVSKIEESEIEQLAERLTNHFISVYGAPDAATARPIALEEISFMQSLCVDHDPNTLLVVQRELTDSGVRESFRAIQPADAEIAQIAVHGTVEE